MNYHNVLANVMPKALIGTSIIIFVLVIPITGVLIWRFGEFYQRLAN